MSYKVIQAGEQIWMAENLAYLPEVCPGGSDCDYMVYGYNDTSVTEAKATYNYKNYGVLYSYDVVMNVCPSGWHLPSDEEWKQLEMHIGMSQTEADKTGHRGTNEGGKLKEKGTIHWRYPNKGATNEIGFTARPGGYCFGVDRFELINQYGYWWSSSEDSANIGHIFVRDIRNDRSTIYRYSSSGSSGFSVRCVKD